MNNVSDTSTEKLRLPFGGLATDQARNERISFLESLNFNLDSYKECDLPSEKVSSNIEGYLGTMTIPVGIVGPLKYKNENVFTAIATTEGALVASMNRGVKALSQCGGFSAHVSKKVMLRAPLFEFNSITESKVFAKWIKSKEDLVNILVKKYSKRAELIELKTNILGRDVEVKFYYTTGDASGQNMTTICTWQACLWCIEEFEKQSEFKIQDFILEGNGASDKKASYGSISNGRGVNVVGECIIDEEVLNTKLKVTSQAILKWFRKSRMLIGPDGMMGDNVNVANAIAGIFTACGQDIASLQESAIGFLNLEEHPRGLYASLRLPNLVIGTVGGGTSLSSQKENLSLMGCFGANKSERFAELICGYCLALELSTISAMASGQFAIAHEKLGRNRPVDFLVFNENLESFVNNKIFGDDKSKLKFLDFFNDSNGIITKTVAQNSNKFIGLSLWELEQAQKNSLGLIKSKPSNAEVLNSMYIMVGMVDPKLAPHFKNYLQSSDFYDESCRESQIYSIFSDSHEFSAPKCFGTYSDKNREITLIALEFLEKDKMRIINSELNSELWSVDDIKHVIKNHLTNLKRLSDEYEAFAQRPKDHNHEFIRKSFETIKSEFSTKLSGYYPIHLRAIEVLESSVPTKNEILIHNDFNPRNIAVGLSGEVFVYDWELARVGLPQRDIIELLCFLVDNNEVHQNLQHILTYAHEEYCARFDHNITTEDWEAGLKVAFSEFVATRMNLYLLGSRLMEYPFLNKLIKNIILLSRELGL